MPTIFAPRTSEYTLSKLPSDLDADNANINVKGKLSMQLDPGINYDLLEDSETQGPSLMFFYTFDNEQDLSNPIYPSDFVSAFSTKYVKNNYEGIAIAGSKELLSVKRGEKETFLYGVSRQGVNNTFKTEEQYVLYAQNNGNRARLDPFILKDEPIGASSYVINLDWTDTSTPPTLFATNAQAASPGPGYNLYAFDGSSFPLSRTAILERQATDNNEYPYVEETTTEIKLHLFVAFFISGPFSNFFWSNLIHLGEIPITLQP
jgi:hypothetical protein